MSLHRSSRSARPVCWFIVAIACLFAAAIYDPTSVRARNVAASPIVGLTPEAELCLPPRLHPVSRMLLDHWLAGRLSTYYFRRWFHMPNSDYIVVSECILSTDTRPQKQ